MVSKERVFVQFENIQERYFIDDERMKVEIVFLAEYEPSPYDWVGIFPKGWRRLEQLIMADYAYVRYSKDNKFKRVMELNLTHLLAKMNCLNAHYQIVYVTKNMEVVGRSSYFCFQRRQVDLHSQGDNAEVFEGFGLAQVSAGTSLADSRNSLKSCSPSSAMIQSVNCGGIGFPLVRPYRSECVLPLEARDYNVSCPTCLASQKQLVNNQITIKELAETNRQLRKKYADLERKLEISFVAQKKLKLYSYYMHQEKQSYELFISELLKCLQNNSPVCVRDVSKGSEMLVQRIGNLDNHIVHFTSRHSPLNERYLKAVIGNQEMKIQELSAKLCDLTKKLTLKNKSEEILMLENRKDNDVLSENNEPMVNNNNVDIMEIVATKEENSSKNGFRKTNEKIDMINSNSCCKEKIEAVVEIHRFDEKLEAIICDLNNNCNFNDDSREDNTEDNDNEN
ncbi:uncharacterized protein LOC142330675 [Lycorma delicatula]|uniref:uncharacterized protein LOC142330675 n=1 Tax=Lycorma delicatula TaxID=130591 RepID=UPI003F518337